MLRLHIARHPPAPAVIYPFLDQRGDAVSYLTPGKGIRAGRLFLQNGRVVECNRDGFSVKVERVLVHKQVDPIGQAAEMS